MSMSNLCVYCKKEVRSRQQALQCDNCKLWQHRTCGTGITQSQYRRMGQEEGSFEWSCTVCKSGSRNRSRSPVRSPISVGNRSILSTINVPFDIQFVPHANSTTVGSLPQHADNSTDISPISEYVLAASANELNLSGIPPPQQFAATAEREEDSINSIHHHVHIPIVNEESLEDPRPPTLFDEDDEPQVETFQILPPHTTKGKPTVVSSLNYRYVHAKDHKESTHWRCHLRTKNTVCRATLIQIGNEFRHGSKHHTCQPVPKVADHLKLIKMAKQVAQENVFKSATAIATEEVQKLTDEFQNCPKMPSIHNIARAANRARQKNRPKEPKPTEFHFELDPDNIPPQFLQQDITTENGRHLLFATPTQLNLLRRASNWYCDGTFHVVKRPFSQLYSIHAFLRYNGKVKQVPLLFILMSHRTTEDYVTVLSAVKQMLPNANVSKITLDYEAAVWRATQEVFPAVGIQGCIFHYSQAVFRKVQSLGLQIDYSTCNATQKFCKKLMALPFLPAENMVQEFRRVTSGVHGALRDLADYVWSTWLTNSVWSLDAVSVYKQSVRTNNDLEGYHNRLNNLAQRKNLNFFVLIQLLASEASLVELQMEMVCVGALERYQRKTYKDMQSKLFQFWEEFEDGERTAEQLLKATSWLLKHN